MLISYINISDHMLHSIIKGKKNPCSLHTELSPLQQKFMYETLVSAFTSYYDKFSERKS